MKRRPLIFFLFLFALLSCRHVTAGVITLEERDFLAPNDGLISFDASTGLEWLDVNYTHGESKLDILARLQDVNDVLAVGGTRPNPRPLH